MTDNLSHSLVQHRTGANNIFKTLVLLGGSGCEYYGDLLAETMLFPVRSLMKTLLRS
jgi:hypothetical protein